LKHYTSREFWKYYQNLPSAVCNLADKNFALLKRDPNHPSVHFKRISRFYSARVGLAYRVLGVASADGIIWFWIGSHSDYDSLL
jgi:hypothetical protein